MGEDPVDSRKQDGCPRCVGRADDVDLVFVGMLESVVAREPVAVDRGVLLHLVRHPRLQGLGSRRGNRCESGTTTPRAILLDRANDEMLLRATITAEDTGLASSHHGPVNLYGAREWRSTLSHHCVADLVHPSRVWTFLG